MPLAKEDVLRTVQEQGPILPIQVKKTLGTDTLLIGAVLSELVDAKQVLVSQTKFGTSPAYYVAGQEKNLEKFFTYLNPSQQKIFMLLKEEKILEDKKQSTENRIALRQLSDFAIAFETKGTTYWKWHDLSETEALKLALAQTPMTKPKKTTQITPKKRKLKRKRKGNKKSQRKINQGKRKKKRREKGKKKRSRKEKSKQRKKAKKRLKRKKRL